MAQPKLFGYTGNWTLAYHGADLATWTLSAQASSYAGSDSVYPVTLVLHVTGNNTITIEEGSATLVGHGAVTWPTTFMRVGDGTDGTATNRYYKTHTSAPNSGFTNNVDNLLIYKDMSAGPDYFLFQNLTSIIAGFGNGKIAGSLTEGAPTTESSGDPFITPLFQ